MLNEKWFIFECEFFKKERKKFYKKIFLVCVLSFLRLFAWGCASPHRPIKPGSFRASIYVLCEDRWFCYVPKCRPPWFAISFHGMNFTPTSIHQQPAFHPFHCPNWPKNDRFLHFIFALKDFSLSHHCIFLVERKCRIIKFWELITKLFWELITKFLRSKTWNFHSVLQWW